MDCLVRLFSGGTIKENGEFVRMRQEVARFDVAPSFDDIMCRVNSLFKVEAPLYKKSLKKPSPCYSTGPQDE